MPTDRPFKDRFGKRGFSKPADRISFAQINRSKIRFLRDHYRKGFILTLHDGKMVLVSQKNAIKLARWILEFPEDGSKQGEMAGQNSSDGKAP